MDELNHAQPTHVHPYSQDQVYFTDNSMDEFLPEAEEESSDSDFGIRRRKQLTFSVSHGKRRKLLYFIVFAVALLMAIFVIGIIIGHFAIPYHFEGTTSNSSGPTPTSAPCTTPPSGVTEEICQNPPLLLISLDGFRASYFERKLTPFMDSLAKEGVRAPYMRSVFPTKTFPNHYSIVTGLYPESHGIVSNAFYDTKLQDVFYIGSPHQDYSQWWKGEPIWVTAGKNGLKTGVYFWPGSEAKIQGRRPDYYYTYNKETSFEERIQTVLTWLDLPQSLRPQLMLVYIEEPDHSGHQGGPDSAQVNSALVTVDQTIEALFQGLEEKGIRDCVNVLFVSDHGMAEYNASRLVNLAQHVPSSLSSNVTFPSCGPVANLGTTDSDALQGVFDSLVTNISDLPLRFYLTQTVPYRLHAGHYHRERYGSVQLLGDIGGFICPPSCYTPSKGEHGYDNIHEEVHAIFQAHGPAFKSDYRPEAFDNIHLYNLMCGLLGIPPAPNNGTRGALYDFLTPSQASQLPPTQAYPPTTPALHPWSIDKCLFPTNESTFISRTSCEECVCSIPGDGVGCEGVNNRSVVSADRALDISDATAAIYISNHLPWGAPPTVGVGLDSCLMVQQHYVSLYSHELHLPLWTAYKLTRQQVQDFTTSPFTTTCVRRDPRLLPSNSASCTDYSPPPSFNVEVANITYSQTTLRPIRMAAGLSTVEIEELTTSLLSNILPQSAKFNTDVWKPLISRLSNWAKLHSTIHIILGVVLDSNHDGFRDPEGEYQWWTNGTRSLAVPTQFYAIAVRCLDDGLEPYMCGYEQLDTIGFLFEHPLAPGGSSDLTTKLTLALTPLRDIERIAGVNFFPSLSVQDQNMLELRIVNSLWHDISI
ncbi:venom phosphodiesterase 2-like [Halichondria panicea]|uniref:venom phosphodiesterase 2-like n=1 Tax=Halichondria panicea TaxID=6063 RepID=UPI00312BBB4B